MLICTVKGSHLAAALQKTTKVRQQNALLPVYESIHCKAQKDRLILTGTNGDTFVITGIKANVETSGKSFLIPYKAQIILMQLKNVDIEIHNGSNISFRFNENVVSFPADKAEDFPIAPDIEATQKFKVEDESAQFKRLLDTVKRYVSDDGLRPALTAVCWTEKELIATDAHRLAISKFKSGAAQPFTALLPKSFVSAFGVLDAAFTVQLSDGFISVNDKTCKVISKLIDSKFPDVKAVVPKESSLHVVLKREELMQNVKVALNIANKASKHLSFEFNSENNSYEVYSNNEDFDEEIKLKGEADFKVNKNGAETFKIAFNGGFLLQVLEGMGEDMVTFEMEKSNRATVIHEAESLYLLMPLMIKEDREVKETKKVKEEEATKEEECLLEEGEE